MKRIIAVLMAIMLIAVAGGCVDKGPKEITEKPNNVVEDVEKPEVEHPVVVIEMENGGKMKLELYPEYAPLTVENFVTLAEEGFYDGLTFHRIVKGFMAQGGDPEGTGSGGSGKTIKGEFAENGVKENTLAHTKGVISMARTNIKDSATSQFFIMGAANQGLDGKYAAFGKLIEGEDVLDKIMDTPVEKASPTSREVSSPVEKVVIKSITVLK